MDVANEAWVSYKDSNSARTHLTAGRHVWRYSENITKSPNPFSFPEMWLRWRKLYDNMWSVLSWNRHAIYSSSPAERVTALMTVPTHNISAKAFTLLTRMLTLTQPSELEPLILSQAVEQFLGVPSFASPTNLLITTTTPPTRPAHKLQI